MLFCHSFDGLFLTLSKDFATPPVQQIFVAFLHLLGRLGVPLFLFLTGYLMLGRTYNTTDTKRFYLKNLLPLLLTWEIWILVLNLFLSLYRNIDFSAIEYLKNALFFSNVNLGMAWYMPMIIGIYLFLPFLANTLHQIPAKFLFLILGVSFFYLFVISTVNPLLQIFGIGSLGSALNLNFGGGHYGVYLVIGYCLQRFAPELQTFFARPYRKLCPLAATILFIALTLLIQHLCFRQHLYVDIWYTWLTLPFIGLGIFLLCQPVHFQGPRTQRFFQELSGCAFGVYLIHQPIQMLISPHFDSPIKYIATFVGSLTISFAIVYLTSKIPKIGSKLAQILFLKK